MIGLAAILSLFGIYFAVMRALKKVFGHLPDMLRDWHGEDERPGVARRPGVLERLGNIESNLKDATNFDSRLSNVEKDLRTQSGQITAVLAIVSAAFGIEMEKSDLDGTTEKHPG